MKYLSFLMVLFVLVLGCSKDVSPPKELPQSQETISKEIKKEVSKVKEKYTETAKKGDSITRLARKAITQYMKDSKKNLTKEQRVYAEDFIAKNMKTVKLKPGDRLELPSTILDEVTSLSLKVETKNLTKYVKKIKWEP